MIVMRSDVQKTDKPSQVVLLLRRPIDAKIGALEQLHPFIISHFSSLRRPNRWRRSPPSKYQRNGLRRSGWQRLCARRRSLLVSTRTALDRLVPLGRGPTRLLSPRRMLSSCGNSSMQSLWISAPTWVERVYFLVVRWLPAMAAPFFINKASNT
jgi:hypothetical protein